MLSTSMAGADPGEGAPGAPPPPKIGKNDIFWRKIVIFHTKYPKIFRASLRSAQFFLSAPPYLKSWIRSWFVNVHEHELLNTSKVEKKSRLRVITSLHGSFSCFTVRVKSKVSIRAGRKRMPCEWKMRRSFNEKDFQKRSEFMIVV